MTIKEIQAELLKVSPNCDDQKAIRNWFEKVILADNRDLNALRLYYEFLFMWNLDSQCDKIEAQMTISCSEIIKSKKSQSNLQLAKAYTYLAMVKFYAIDRLKYLEKALDILHYIPDTVEDKEYLMGCCYSIQQNPNRGVLFYIGDNGKFRI